MLVAVRGLFPVVLRCGQRWTSLGHLSSSPLNVLFFGNDNFSLSSLKPLHQQLLSDTGLIHSLSVISVQQSIIARYATENNLPMITWPVDRLEQNYDLGIVVSFGHLIPKHMIRGCRAGILNVHGSLLPRWRGASPIHRAILAGDRVTGVTIMLIEADRFDVGDIVCQSEYVMPERATTAEVHTELAELGARLLMQTIRTLPFALSDVRPQPKAGVTQAPKPKKSDGAIVFEEMTSTDVDRRCRALDGLVDLSTEWIDGSKLKLSDVSDPQELNVTPLDSLIEGFCPVGSIVYHKRRRLLCFKCKDNQWIGFASVSMHGSRKMSALEFFNGFMSRLLKNPCPGCKLKQIKGRAKL